MEVEKYAAGHLFDSVAYVDRKSKIDYAVSQLTPMADKFDAVVVCGLSGLLLGPSIADRLKKNVIVIRKKYDETHSANIFEGVYSNNYIIVDDFISTGETVHRIKMEVERQLPKAKLFGMWFYNDNGFRDRSTVITAINDFIKRDITYHQQKSLVIQA